MQNQRKLPPLDLLPGFEAAARHLSFTKAADELHLTQSAVSRQVQALEEVLGVALFQRRHRALLLTDAGQLLQQSVSEMLGQLRELTRRIRGEGDAQLVTVTTTFSFASLWLVPRLPTFRQLHPKIDVRISADNTLVDLTRDRIDIAVRYCAPDKAPAKSIQLFGEAVMPVCSPGLLRDRKRPLRKPADLRNHILLHDDFTPGTPWLEWVNWLEAHGLQGLTPAGELRFSHYDTMIRAAMDGQGIALGRWPLLAAALRRRQLVAPFESEGPPARAPVSARAFHVFCEPRAAQRPEVCAFCDWIQAEAREDVAAGLDRPRPAARVRNSSARRRRA
jgi:DNA-binding transcriptional LysR family regulator